MQCYTQLTPPTAVSACVCLPFLSASANNLIVSKESLLQIFVLKSVVTDLPDSGEPAEASQGRSQRRERLHTTKLVLIGQYEVSGTITALARVKMAPSKSGGELLLVALRDTKMSLVEWDPERYNISTISIHSYEREELQGAPWHPPVGQYAPSLVVDPRSRCAALKFAARQLAILRFQQSEDDLAVDDYDADPDTKTKRRQSSKMNVDAGQLPIPKSFVLSLLQLDPALVYPIHLAFLHEYREPTLGVLSSRTAVSAGLLPERRDTVSYTVYTLDLEHEATTTLLSVTNLPYDMQTVFPLPLPIGGALLIGTNEIVHVDQAGKTNGVAVNEFAQKTSAFPLVSQSDLRLKLEGCRIEHLGSQNGELLLILNTGSLAILSFRVDGRTVSSLSIYKVTPENGGNILSTRSSCTSLVGRGRMFVGSEDTDSTLIGWSFKGSKVLRRQSTMDEETTNGDDDAESDVESMDDFDFYAEAKPQKKTSVSLNSTGASSDDYMFKMHDSLVNLAPLSAVSLFGSTLSDTQQSRSSDEPRDLVGIVGSGNISSLVKLSPHISFQAKTALDIQNAARIWSFHAQRDTVNESMNNGHELHNTMIISTKQSSETEESLAYYIGANGTTPLESGDFEPEAGFTIDASSFLGGSRIIQVLKTEIRVFDGGE